MMLKKWEELPEDMQNAFVRPYYDILQKRHVALLVKAVFDRVAATLMLIILSPVFLLLAVWIKADSEGEVFFRQARVTRYGKTFHIYKFRTMVKDAEHIGAQVTTSGDMRVTKVGKKIRACRLDEIPQLINIVRGEMSFVGTRPEVPKYVQQYTPEMLATLLLPAGVTSEASIEYKDEERLLSSSADVDKTYIEQILPEKMKWNLRGIMGFSFVSDLVIMLKTVRAVV